MNNSTSKPNMPQSISTHSRQVHPDNCYACGRNNPRGLKFDFEYIPKLEKIHTTISFNKDHSNTPVTVHGGILSAIMDEAMGCLCSHLGFIVLTSEFKVEYKKLVDIGKPYLLESRMTGEDKRYVYTAGSLTEPVSKKIHTLSSGSFRKIPERFFKRYFDEASPEFRAIMDQIIFNCNERIKSNVQDQV